MFIESNEWHKVSESEENVDKNDGRRKMKRNIELDGRGLWKKGGSPISGTVETAEHLRGAEAEAALAEYDVRYK